MKRFGFTLIILAISIAVTLLLALWSQQEIPVQTTEMRAALTQKIEFGTLFGAIRQDEIQEVHDRVVKDASRLSGTQAESELSKWVEEEFNRLGLEVVIQSFPVTVPVTRKCQITLEGGSTLARLNPGEPVEIHPFWPNLVRTCTTPPEGIVAKVLDVGAGSLEDLEGKDVTGKIALVTQMKPGFDWLDTAKLGPRAILFQANTNPLAYYRKILKFPGDMPRFLISGDANQLIGKRVRIVARVDWQVREIRNVFGLLRPDHPSTEAITLIANTDSWSVVPDLAPGYRDAASITSLIAMARSLTPQQHGLSRPVIFAALSGRYQASEGMRRMFDSFGGMGDFPENFGLLEKRLYKAQKSQLAIDTAAQALSGIDYWALGQNGEAELWSQHGLSAQRALSAVMERIISAHVADTQRAAEIARVGWVGAGRPEQGDVYEALQGALRRQRRALAAVSANLTDIKEFYEDVLDESSAREMFYEQVQTMRRRAEDALRYQKNTMKVARLFEPYAPNYFIFVDPSGLGGHMAYGGDQHLCDMLEGGRDGIVAAWLKWKGISTSDKSVFGNYFTNMQAARHHQHRGQFPGAGYSHWEPSPQRPGKFLELSRQKSLNAAQHPAILFSNNRQAFTYQTPLDTKVDFKSLVQQTQLMVGLAAQIASGAEQMDFAGKAASGVVNWFSDFGGDVLSLGASNSLLPSQRVADAIVVFKGQKSDSYYLQKTHDGTFRFPAADVHTPDTAIAEAYTIYNPTGQLTGAKDMGPEGLRFPTQVAKEGSDPFYNELETRRTILLARLAPTDMYGTFDAGGHAVSLEVLDARFRTPPTEFSLAEHWEQGATIFMKPGDRFYLIYKTLHNQAANMGVRTFSHTGLEARGFLLGHRPSSWKMREKIGFWGDGYLAGRDRQIIFQEADTALSVALSNDERIRGQKATGVADPVTVELNQRSRDKLEQGLGALASRRYADAYRDLNASLGISMRAYPQIRLVVFDAVGGIMLYMFLIVPFSFFAERLIFGFSDIRARLAGIFLVFIGVFGIIRLTHPAYQLLSSSVVVLVGFVIFILCLLILGFVLGKFSERLRTWRRSGNAAATEDSSPLGAAGSAFTLGVGNMRKRKMRTACTALTLMLISFCLISFTAPRPQLKQRQVAVGSAAFNGVLFREYASMDAVQRAFKDQGKLVSRRGYSQEHEYIVSYEPDEGPIRHSYPLGLLHVESEESRVTGMDKTLLAGGKWFGPSDRDFCYLSDAMARELGLKPSSVVKDNIKVWFQGRSLTVYGVFDSRKFAALRDADQEPLLPPQGGRESRLGARSKAQFDRLAGQSGPAQVSVERVPAAEMILLHFDPVMTRRGRGPSVVGPNDFTSAVLLFDDLPYGTIHQSIGQLLDQSPQFARYAIDGLAFFGARLRSVGLEGYADIVVPLLVASFIVLNTMLGSVYERTKEISIYSAVGLSPRHIFYLFLAESLVYAVIGVVAGYLLALGLQWISHLGDGFLGLTMNYSSRSAIYVSLTLMVVVIASSFVPAYLAARVAAPSEHVKWSLPPEHKPGCLRFDLPFTYIGRDILGAVPFVSTWFDGYGEDSSGEFTAASPNIYVTWPDGRAQISVATTVWLRPYDLGVSQSVAISVKPSSDPTIYQVAIEVEHLTGSPVSWRRTNEHFIQVLRQHLLRWRSLPDRGKVQLAEDGARLLKV
ncbi:MAG: hypothetical protein CMJ20_09120 [Phycisphaeraceae bacterium]|nr:hypothetical protein [Phycisphaeraceae bacterium]|tara:strand:- start:1095 stop:6122 length:5028 start_codon:yes stop_codon:yes gene_type:complete